ncbi:MAG: sigma-70 family RNA polymerase sigma factor, partial [Candidatus Thermoplasmatota archaeon]|nr:sigma-70 family RNA polymerase sigma factor [Candidatus Thermoplasmatota archaeon]
DQLKHALATYTDSGGQGSPSIDTAQAIALMQEKHEVACAIMQAFDGALHQYQTGMKIALNKARDLLRSNGADSLCEDVADYGDTLAAADATRPDRRAERGQALERIQGILNRMPAHYREVLILKHLEEHSNEEIAAMLDETVENVKVRTFRARQMFKQLFGELS